MPRTLTPLITTLNRGDETLWTSGLGKAHNYFPVDSVGSTGVEDVLFTHSEASLFGIVGAKLKRR